MKPEKLFGTDGIRGIANTYPITPEMALLIGKAVSCIFMKRNGTKKRHKIVIGKDTRLSGYMIESALQAGIVSMGANVLLVGPMPTPAIAHLTRSMNADAGIVISASHNPANDNGIKIFGPDGYKLPDEVEEEIEKLVLGVEISCEHIKGEMIGKAFRVDEAYGRYIEFVKSSINSESLSGFKIVLDCANGAAYSIAPKVFRELGAEVIVLNSNPDGLNINQNCGATHPEVAAEMVKKEKADIGITLDGDADRLIVCDEKGEIIDGDYILTFYALNMMRKNKLNHNTLVVTDYSNLGVDEAIKKAGGKVVRTQNGDRYVIEAMKKGDYNLGGEFSGHMIFRDYVTTGDGIVSALQLIKVIKEQKINASQVRKVMKKYPQVLVSLEVKNKKPFEQMPNVIKKVEEIEKKLKGSGRLLLRYSGTQNMARVMIEGKNQEQIRKMVDEIKVEIQREIGV